jgi:hypothetical protein
MRELQDLNNNYDLLKGRNNEEALSTTVSECQSINYQSEKDVEEL